MVDSGINLEEHFDVIHEKDEDRVCCPFCSEEDTGYHLYINLKKGVYNCFKCHAHGTVRQLMQKLKLKPTRRVTRPSYDKLRTLFQVEEPSPQIEIKEFLPLMNSSGAIGKTCLKYLVDRGVKIEDVHYHRLHYAWEGKYKLRIILPCFENGEFVYFTARSLSDVEGIKRYLNPPKGRTKLTRSQVVFNIDSLNEAKSCVVFEGALNAIIYGRDAVALFGKYSNQEQIAKLISKNCKQYIVALDSDAIKEAYQLAKYLHSYNKQVRIAQFPEGKDAADLGRERTQEILQRSKIYTESDYVRSRITF